MLSYPLWRIKTKMDKKKNNSLFTWIFLVIFVIISLASFFIFMVPSINKNNQERYDFYEEWCPKLGAEIVEPIKNYNYNPRCFIEKESVVKFFFITEVNGEYKLQEYTR